MKKVSVLAVLLVSLLLTVNATAASGPTFDWTLYDSNIKSVVCTAASGACADISFVAVRTQRSGITIRRIEYTSVAPILGTMNPFDGTPVPFPPDGFCPRSPTIGFFNGSYTTTVGNTTYTNTPIYSFVINPKRLYTDSGPVAVKIKAGTQLSVISFFLEETFDYQNGFSTECATPPGNIVIQYTTP